VTGDRRWDTGWTSAIGGCSVLERLLQVPARTQGDIRELEDIGMLATKSWVDEASQRGESLLRILA
jgi:hypothetical protein